MKKIPQLLILLALITALAGIVPGAASAWQSIDRQAESPIHRQTGSPDLAEPTRLPGLFLPFISRPSYAVTGKVMDASGRPLAGVALLGQNGQTVTTDENGAYTFSSPDPGSYAIAPSLDGYVFSPAVVSVSSPKDASGRNFIAMPADTELLVNGGFEAGQAWQFPVTPKPASYSTAAAHSGARSVQTGIIETKNVYSYSSARQLVTIPAGATQATLSAWLFPVSSEAGSALLPQRPSGPDFGSAALTSDAQYILVLDPGSNPAAPEDDTLLETLLWMRSDARTWTLHTFNLTRYAGDTIKIQVGTYNDGYDGVTGLYVDDASLLVSTSGGTTPAPTPTPTGDPGACTNPIGNSSFEFSGSWNIPVTEYPAGVSEEAAHTGARSMRTGIVKAGHNTFSYSDAWQTVSIPANAANPRLSLWMYPVSGDTSLLSLPKAPALKSVFGKQALSSDMQYVLILDIYGQVLSTPVWQISNAQTWIPVEIDLKAYKGRTIRIQFGTYNDGLDGTTAMYVDDVVVDICTAVTPTPTAVPGPTATPNPALCAEKIANNSFETTSAWEIPITAFSAGYSTELAHTGAYAMRTGIVHRAHNRFSYSDFRQAVTIPAEVTSATLTLWLNPASGDSSSLAVADHPQSPRFGTESLAGDVQYILILDQFGNWIDTLLWMRNNTQTWAAHSFDLTDYAGATIKIQVGTYNDGLDGVSSLFVDDVSLQVCP